MELDWKNIKRILLIIFLGAVIFTAVQNFGGVLGFISGVLGLFAPVTAAFCIAFVLNVLLTALETKVFAFMGKSRKKAVVKLRRPICLVLTYLIAFGIVSVLMLVIIPDIIETVTYIAEKLPAFADDIREWANALLEKYNIDKSVIPEVQINWTAAASALKSWLSDSYNQIFNGAVGITTSVFTGVFDTIFSFVISVYILAQKERIGAFVKRVINALIPDRINRVVYHVAYRTQESFSRFIGGQLIESLILGVLCFIGMTIFRFPNALIISVLISVMSLVPIVGATIGVVVGFLLIVISNPLRAVFFVIFFLVLQQVEGNLIYPRVVGKAVGLPGVLVVSAVLIGGNIGGVLGTLVAVPTCAVLFVLLKELVEYMNRQKKQKKSIVQLREDENKVSE